MLACTALTLSPDVLVSDTTTVKVFPTVVPPLVEKENDASPAAKTVGANIKPGNKQANTVSATFSHLLFQ